MHSFFFLKSNLFERERDREREERGREREHTILHPLIHSQIPVKAGTGQAEAWRQELPLGLPAWW